MTSIPRIDRPARPFPAQASHSGPSAPHPGLHSARGTVVLLHSSAASARQWDALAQGLLPDFEVHALDLHGHGRQAPWRDERPLSVEDEAALAMPILERARGAHLIGHSYGAAIAVHLAASRPALVRSLTVFEPVLFDLLAQHEPQGAAALEVIDMAQTVFKYVTVGLLPAAAEHFVDYWSGTGSWKKLGVHQRAVIASRMPMVAQHFGALYAASLLPTRLAQLRMPVLCLSGGRSTPAAVRIAALLRDLLPKATHEVMDGLGHLGPITHPTIVNARVLRFLGGEFRHLDTAA